MGRSGLEEGDCEDQWAYIRWRGRVASATRGKRGQRLLRELLAALDAMPEKALVADEFVTPEGACCTLGALALSRGWSDAQEVDSENHEQLASRLDVAEVLVREVEWENDYSRREAPEARWQRMRAWVASQLRPQEETAHG